MADESTQLVLAFFDSEDAADKAAAALQEWDQATEEIKLGNVGVLVKGEGSQVKEHKLGPRSGKKGAGIGMVLGVVAAPFTGGLSLLGSVAAGAAGGGIVGTLFRKGMPKEDVERISAELEAGHAAVGALVEEGDAAQVTAKLAALGGKPQAHEVSDAGLQEVAATVEAGTEPASTEAADAGSTTVAGTDTTTAETSAAGSTAEAGTEPAPIEPSGAGSTIGAGTDTTTAPPAAVRSGKFEVLQDAAGKFRWRLKATNGRIIATGSEGYTTQENCENGINSVKANAPTAEVVAESGGKPQASDAGLEEAAAPAALTSGKFELYKDAAGEYRWRLRDADGRIIATGGEGYTTHENCENGINSVKVNAPTAEIVAVAAV